MLYSVPVSPPYHTTPKSSIGFCRCSIADARFGHQQTTFFFFNHHHHHPSRCLTATSFHYHQCHHRQWPPLASIAHAHNHHSKQEQRQVIMERDGWEHLQVPHRQEWRGNQTTNDVIDVIVRCCRLVSTPTLIPSNLANGDHPAHVMSPPRPRTTNQWPRWTLPHEQAPPPTIDNPAPTNKDPAPTDNDPAPTNDTQHPQMTTIAHKQNDHPAPPGTEKSPHPWTTTATCPQPTRIPNRQRCPSHRQRCATHAWRTATDKTTPYWLAHAADNDPPPMDDERPRMTTSQQHHSFPFHLSPALSLPPSLLAPPFINV